DARVAALSVWTQGFLDGLVDAGLAGDADLSEDAASALGDLVAIARAGFEGEGDNDDEADFAELVEYVRVAAILIFAELASPAHIAAPGSDTLHLPLSRTRPWHADHDHAQRIRPPSPRPDVPDGGGQHRHHRRRPREGAQPRHPLPLPPGQR